MKPRNVLSTIIACAMCFLGSTHGHAETGLKAGVYAQNINPVSLPVWVNGNIAAAQAERIHDPLHARCLVLSDPKTTLAICIVDNCILPVELVDRARKLSSEKIGIPPENILIAATHTHSAVSVAGVHGTPIQEDYTEQLPQWIADGLGRASERRVDAQLGWGNASAEKFIYCRRWLMKPGSLAAAPFTGRDSDEVTMNPGYDNPNKLAPVGPVDRTIPILSIQTTEGKPLAVLASFSTHYAGSPALSADYFGVVANRLAKALRGDQPEQFLGIMANGTSGDANCIDFSKPREPFTHIDVGNYVAELILAQIPQIEHRHDLTLDAAFSSLTVDARVPTATEVTEAQTYIDTHFPGRLPQSMIENYARETVLLSQLPKTRVMNCQTLRIGDGVIVANPCESYGETGLKLRQASPFKSTMNIGLANGHAGYIPPPAHFQLGGYTTWRARTSCLEVDAEPKMVEKLTDLMTQLHQRFITASQLSATLKASSESTPASQPLRQTPLSPKESLENFQLEPEWNIALAASEPVVKDPVAMQIDTYGRMWVIEMTDYPNGPTGDQKPLGRLVILEDKDNDLVYESSHVFADGLLFATGLQLWKDGALVTIAGKLVWLRDTDGDNKADQRELWLEGFQEQNPQLRANDPSIGWDGRIYIANGLRGGMVGEANSEERIPLTNHDLRLHPETRAIQLITGPSQFGLTWDQNGNRYFCSNRQPCREVVLEPLHSDLTTLPGFIPATRDASPSETLSQVRPIVDAWTTSNLHAGQFTAACGVLVTHSSLFPGAQWGHVLTCEPTGSLVQRRSLERIAGHTTAKSFEHDSEWLASRDPWFRPVNLYEGPAGEIYVLDMHRAVIEHPEWVPEELKQRPDERLGEHAGRIYRLTTSKTKVSDAFARIKARQLHSASPEILVESLQAATHWERTTAQRLLLESPADSHVLQKTLLQQVLKQSSRPSAKLLALGILSTRNQIDSDVLEIALRDADPVERTATWRLLANYEQIPELSSLKQELKASLQSLDRDEFRAACWAIARASASNTIDADWLERHCLTELAQQFPRCLDDPATLMAIAGATRQAPVAWLQHICSIKQTKSLPLSSQQDLLHNYLTVTRFWTRNAANMEPSNTYSAMMQQITGQSLERSGIDEQLSFYGMLYGYLQAGGEIQDPLKDTIRQQVASLAANHEISSEARVLGFQILSLIAPADSRTLALNLIETESAALLQSALVRLQLDNEPDLAEKILQLFASAPPQRRSFYFEAIRNNPQRMERFLEALEKGEYSVSILDTVQRQTLSSTLNLELRDRLQRVLGASISSDRESIIARYRQSFSTSPNLDHGKKMFAQHCSACHKIDQVGTAVGPDISDARDQSFEKLLVSILDPNRAIDANYFRYVCQTNDGSIVDGLLEESSSENVVLRLQNGNRISLPRADIQQLKATGVSLMPVGFEAQLSPEAMNDLIAYIKNWRYTQQNVPAQAIPPTKK